MKESLAAALPALAWLCAASGAYAQAEREAGPHEHGVAQLNVAVDAGEVLLELHSPGMNLVGFEHAPSNAAEEQALADALRALESGAQVFGFPEAASCTLQSAAAESAAEAHEHEPEPQAEADHEHSGEGPEVHSEVHVQWTYSCANPDRLTGVDVLIFERFPGTEEFEVQVASDRGQSRIELTRSAYRIDF
jgi:hypothetical protein